MVGRLLALQSESTLRQFNRKTAACPVQGGPREPHLHILRRMREHLSAGHSLTYFQYDATKDASLTEPPNENQRIIIETLQGMAVVLLDEKTKNDGNWTLRFGLGWTTARDVDLELSCDGSEQPQRPAIDFTLKITLNENDIRQAIESLPDLCYRHGVSWKLSQKTRKRNSIELRQRLFSPGCNPETVKHIFGNYHSYWDQLQKQIMQPLPPSGKT